MVRNIIRLRALAGGHGGRFVLFGLVGAFNTLTDFLAYVVLISLGVAPALANIGAFAFANPLSYFCNAAVTFRRNGASAPVSSLGYGKFLAAHLLSLTISTALVFFLASSIGPFLAKISAVGVTALINYTSSAFLVFKKPGKP